MNRKEIIQKFEEIEEKLSTLEYRATCLEYGKKTEIIYSNNEECSHIKMRKDHAGFIFIEQDDDEICISPEMLNKFILELKLI